MTTDDEWMTTNNKGNNDKPSPSHGNSLHFNTPVQHTDYKDKNFARVNIWVTFVLSDDDNMHHQFQKFLRKYATSIFTSSKNAISIAAWDNPLEEEPMWNHRKDISVTDDHILDYQKNAVYIDGWGPWLSPSPARG